MICFIVVVVLFMIFCVFLFVFELVFLIKMICVNWLLVVVDNLFSVFEKSFFCVNGIRSELGEVVVSVELMFLMKSVFLVEL